MRGLRAAFLCGGVLLLVAAADAREWLGGRRAELAYLAALETWAAGAEEAAAQQLFALQREAARVGPRGHEALRWMRRQTLLRLGRLERAALLPAARLHQRAYRLHARQDPSEALAWARQAAVEVAEAYSSRAPTAEERRLGAGLLASLGGDLHGAFQEVLAADLYQRALRLDPGCHAALEGLAAVLEKRGEALPALELLERLVAQGPTSAEARLRHAVLLARTGRSEAAARRLAELLPGATPTGWVQSVAAQELARHHLQRGEVATAAAVVAGTLERLPCEPALVLQASYLAERAGGDGRELLEALLGGCPAVADATARGRYNRRPEAIFERLEQELAAAERAARPNLAAALAVQRRSRP